MNKIKRFFKRLWRVEYRLSVWTNRGTLQNFEGASIGEINSKLAEYGINLHGLTWTLYKTGRFYLPEREIQTNQKGEQQ